MSISILIIAFLSSLNELFTLFNHIYLSLSIITVLNLCLRRLLQTLPIPPPQSRALSLLKPGLFLEI